ncbi:MULTISPECIES: low molecular weight protein-tyrosine-phosphatase [Maribacter]|uniref:protein-tyrosine-phosphatase n=1 Tax=Maribacter flavus TaxID=1658664 RepID=A0A5B2TRY9_9FLAO|nr:MULTISPECIES: low molecular weight protein-tyrosine-phosphatase [Maribacter]KAA2216873.1 low molecular weight phosphotyrosine protein phosphatase [Maribacter flavus]MDC6405988.1 low molecular weight phosphotyrosine protein phosphatase [Maribacter sp. PR66]MEE1973227.1 low molecular weight protein-tyrosine-phosphatase [Maribacter flavus]
MKTKVLMVCLGNICRSPLAEGILKNKVDTSMVFVDSAGTGGYHIGNPPDSRSIAVARKYGIDISNQICRKLTAADLEEFDVIYAMDKSNYGNIIGLSKNKEQARKVKLLLSEVKTGDVEVPDPYYDSVDGFEKVFQMIDAACGEIAKKLSE